MATKPRTAVASPTDRIAELVERRQHLLELKGLTEQAPRSLSEAEADIPRVIEILVSRCEPQVAWLAQPAGWPDLARQLGQQDEAYAAIPAASLAAWMLPDAMAAALKRDLAAAYGQMPKPMTGAAKHSEILRLQTEIAAVEAAVAEAFWQATDSGLSLPIPDISGAALIGLAG